MPEQVLVASRFPKAMMVRIGQRFDLLDGQGKSPVENFTTEQLKGIRAIIISGAKGLTREQLASLPALGAIICYGTGYDAVDFAAAAERGIVVGHSPAANSAAVADLAMTLMLAVTRRLLPADNYVRSGSWSGAKPSPLMSPQPGNPGRRIGIYGMGANGRKIAARAAAFETEVAYHSRSRHDVPYRYVPKLEALVQWCDVLIIAVRAGAETNHAIGAEMLRKLGKNGYVVNISRGSVIDEQALIAALADQTIAGAALDVYEQEPHAPDALTAFPNVVLTPHVGGHTLESHVAMQDCVIANLEAFFAGKPLPHRVKQNEGV
jgi:lactate dehydrogenase-like 2-hydroxyacid dehydrogenase